MMRKTSQIVYDTGVQWHYEALVIVAAETKDILLPQKVDVLNAAYPYFHYVEKDGLAIAFEPSPPREIEVFKVANGTGIKVCAVDLNAQESLDALAKRLNIQFTTPSEDLIAVVERDMREEIHMYNGHRVLSQTKDATIKRLFEAHHYCKFMAKVRGIDRSP